MTLALAASPLPAKDKNIQDSIHALRGINPDKMTDEEKRVKVVAIDTAYGDVSAGNCSAGCQGTEPPR